MVARVFSFLLRDERALCTNVLAKYNFISSHKKLAFRFRFDIGRIQNLKAKLLILNVEQKLT